MKDLFVILVLFFSVPMIMCQQKITNLSLNSEQTIKQEGYQYKYFSVDITNPSNDQILLVTVSSDITTYIDIFLSSSDDPQFQESYKYPNYMNHTHECFYRSVDTCALQLADTDNKLTIYFSVETDQTCTYTLSVSRQNIFPIKLGKNYTVSLMNAESGILMLDGSEFVQNQQKLKEIVIECTYKDISSIGYFQMIATLDKLPDNSNNQIISESLNSFNKILILPLPSNISSKYYILVEGNNGTKLELDTFAVQNLNNPSIEINSSITYLIHEPITYFYNQPFDTQKYLNSSQSPLPLFVDLYAFRGFGVFDIQYCNGLYNFTFQNTNGQNGEIAINPDMRAECFDQVQFQGGLLIQNMQISLAQIVYEFGYEIYVSEGNYEVVLFPGQKEYGVLLETQNNRELSISTYSYNNNQTEELTVIVQTITGILNYKINSCTKQKKKIECQTIAGLEQVSASDSLQYFNFSCPLKSQCSLIIQHSDQPQDSEYVISVSLSSVQPTQIAPNVPTVDMVELNAYNYYIINITALRSNKNIQFSNVTLLQIRNTVVNGDILVLSSVQNSMPEFDDIFSGGSDVKVTWEGITTYMINDTWPSCIYVSVLGEAESIYYLQYTFNTSANVPQRYMNIIDDAQNDYTLTAETPYILLKYSSHIIPFSIKFDPSPDCIAYGTMLPFDQNCSINMPTTFHEKVVYFNISQHFLNDQDSFKFTAYANSGQYLLEKDRPAIIACLDQCYELVSIIIKSDEAKIIHSGFGSIQQIPSGEKISNGVLTLICALPPCSYQLNATLPYGGQMQVSYESEHSAEITWYTKPFSFTKTDNFFLRLPKYSFQSTNIIFYSQAVSLAVFYKVISLDQKYQNTIAYQYPSTQDFDGFYISDPLRSISIITIQDQILNQKGCNNANSLCIATLTIYGNERVQYSEQYIKEGLGYYSSSSFEYSLALNEPIQLKRSYSVSSFYYRYNQNTPDGPLYLSIQALSNCRPMIQLENSDKMHYNSIQVPSKMPGQTVVNFKVITNQLCRFQTALTTVPYEVILSNIMYPIQYKYFKQTQAIYTYHHTLYYDVDQIQIKTSAIVDKIFVSILGSESQTPSQSNNIANGLRTSSLSFPVANTTKTYLISIVGKNPHSTIILINKKRPINLLHNQEFKYTFQPNTKSEQSQSDNKLQGNLLTFKYETDSNFLIFIEVNQNNVNLTVNVEDAYAFRQQQILSTIVTNQSEPWVVVNSFENSGDNNLNVNNKLKSYIITAFVTNYQNTQTTTNLKIHVEEDGVLGLPKIYNGVSYYDALLHMQAMNCYQYHPPYLKNPKRIIIDFQFINPQDSQQNNAIKSIVTLFKGAISLHQNFIQLSPNVYRTTVDYYSSNIYKICFELQNSSAIAQQYSIVVNMPNMEMIYPQQTLQKYNPKTNYQIYEYINHFQENQYQITLTNCIGKSQILASDSYYDMITGKMTQIKPEWEWSVGGVSASIVNISHGYYYIGAKNAVSKDHQLYELNVDKAYAINGTVQIIEQLFGIDRKISARAYIVDKEDGIQTVGLQIPPVVSDRSIKPIKIVYKLFLMNLEDPKVQKLPYTIDAYSRCPSLLPSLLPVSTNQTFATQGIYFEIPLSKFQPKANLSARAQVTVGLNDGSNTYNKTIYYYYGYQQLQVTYNSNGLSPIYIAIITILSIGAVASIVIIVYLYIRKRRTSIVDFQARQFQNAEIQMQTRKQKSSTNKPINKDIGYGQFVDQIP